MDAEKEAVFSAAREAGALRVRPLFPDSKDAELQSLYTVDASSHAAVGKLLGRLGKHQSVEFVEPQVTRTLKLR
jgi:hypothetical protein